MKKAKPVTPVVVAPKNTKEGNTAANPESWAVQLGSFSDRINASNLMKKLQDAGFSAYVHNSKTVHGDLIRVLVGPQLHRSDASKIQKQLQRQFSLKSIIVKVNS
jgi:DedD protein